MRNGLGTRDHGKRYQPRHKTSFLEQEAATEYIQLNKLL